MASNLTAINKSEVFSRNAYPLAPCIKFTYFHYIENIGDEELHFAVFFSYEKPQDIGISGAFGSYSN